MTSELLALRAALRGVPVGGASGDAPAWLIALHRAACAAAEIEVVERGTPCAAVGVLTDEQSHEQTLERARREFPPGHRWTKHTTAEVKAADVEYWMTSVIAKLYARIDGSAGVAT